MPQAQEKNLVTRIQNGALEADGVSVLNGKSIKALIASEFGADYGLSGVYDLLRRLNLTLIKPRPQHEKNDVELMAQWKEITLPNKLAEIKAAVPDQKIDIWFQDEMRFGDKTRISSAWKLSGSSWSTTKQIGFRNQYIYGAVNPHTGDHVGLVFSECSTAAMNIHLGLVSQAIAAGTHAILIMDQAGWHSSAKELVVPPNITILDLPPYSPELNPVERLWLWLKDKHLSNRVIKKGEDLLELGCKIWNTLNNDIVKSVCHEPYLAFTNFS